MPDLDDLGIDPWGDLGIIQVTPEPTPENENGLDLNGVYNFSQSPANADMAGDGGIEVASINPDSQVYYIQSYSGLRTYTRTASNGAWVSGSTISVPYYPNGLSFSDSNFKYLSTGQFLLSSATTSVTSGQNFGYGIGAYTGNPYIDFHQNVAVESDIYQGLRFNGSVSFGFTMQLAGSSTNYSYLTNPTVRIYADTVQILVNGVPCGKVLTADSDHFFNFSSFDVDISVLAGKSISTVGYRFGFTASPGQVLGYTSIAVTTTNNRKIYIGMYFEEKDVSVGYLKSDVGGGTVVIDGEDQRHEETKGLLNTIIAAIKNIATSISELPAMIVSALIDGLKGLFVPSEEDLAGIKDNYTQLLEERLGFVWQAGEMVISFGQSVLLAFENSSDFQFEFPGISFELPELGQVTLIEAQAVSVNNAFMDVMQPVLGTIVSFICVLAFINTCERMVVAWISGVSYFHFLKGE